MPGIFISRLLAGGLAESTGLLAVNDEVLEVNGIEVVGKSLDQVTDMMVANSSNLIVTVKPANQRTLAPRRGDSLRNSNMSHGSMLSRSSSTPSNANSDTVLGNSNHHNDLDEQDEDEIRDLTNMNRPDGMDGNGALGGGGLPSSNNLASTSQLTGDRRQVLHL